MNTRLILLFALLPALSACFRSSPMPRFYMLKPIESAPSASAPTPSAQGPVIGLGPIRIPAYLDRPQIVTAISEQEYKVAEDQRWAERLDSSVTRVLTENLSNLMPDARIVLYPWLRQQPLDAQVSVNIQQFHADASGQVHLSALWTLSNGAKQGVQRKFVCRQPASTSDYGKIAAAQSECLGQLSSDIGTALQFPVPAPALPSTR